MTSIEQLRERARRYRQLAQRQQGDAAAALLALATELERQALAFEAYTAAAHLSTGQRWAFKV